MPGNNLIEFTKFVADNHGLIRNAIQAAEQEKQSPFNIKQVDNPDVQDGVGKLWDEIQRQIDRGHPEFEDFRFSGPVWWLVLNHEQTDNLEGVLSTGGGAILAVAGVASPAVLGALAVSIAYIKAMDLLGGNNGVEITGIVGTPGVIVTPRLKGIFAELIDLARQAVAAATVLDWVITGVGMSPALALALEFGPLAAVVTAVAAGTPLGVALAALVKPIEEILGLGNPDPDEHGAVLADRGAIGPWESFLMGDNGDGSVSLLSHMGLFCADRAGGYGVHANRIQVGEWERWTLIRHGDGTVSLRSSNGHFFVAESGGGQVCNANRTAIGDWEKFWLDTLPGGRVALRTFSSNQYVSVQK